MSAYWNWGITKVAPYLQRKMDSLMEKGYYNFWAIN